MAYARSRRLILRGRNLRFAQQCGVGASSLAKLSGIEALYTGFGLRDIRYSPENTAVSFRGMLPTTEAGVISARLAALAGVTRKDVRHRSFGCFHNALQSKAGLQFVLTP